MHLAGLLPDANPKRPLARVPESTPQSASPQCGFEGNADLYGIGVRVAFYLQLVTTIITSFSGIDLPRTLTINLWFAFALFLALIYTTANDNVNNVEAYITLYLLDVLVALGGIVMKYRTKIKEELGLYGKKTKDKEEVRNDRRSGENDNGKDKIRGENQMKDGDEVREGSEEPSEKQGTSKIEVSENKKAEKKDNIANSTAANTNIEKDDKAKDSKSKDKKKLSPEEMYAKAQKEIREEFGLGSKYSLAFHVSYMALNLAVGAYGAWFWWAGIKSLPSPTCTPYGFFFAKTRLLGWLTTLHRVLYSARIIVSIVDAVFVFAIAVTAIGLIIVNHQTIPRKVFHPDHGKREWLSWILDSNPMKYEGFRLLATWIMVRLMEDEDEIDSENPEEKKPLIESDNEGAGHQPPIQRKDKGLSPVVDVDLERGQISENEEAPQKSSDQVISTEPQRHPSMEIPRASRSTSVSEDGKANQTTVTPGGKYADDSIEGNKDSRSDNKPTSGNRTFIGKIMWFFTIILGCISVCGVCIGCCAAGTAYSFLKFIWWISPVFIVLQTELSIRWNNISGVHNLGAAGQLIPLIVSFGTILQGILAISLYRSHRPLRIKLDKKEGIRVTRIQKKDEDGEESIRGQ